MSFFGDGCWTLRMSRCVRKWVGWSLKRGPTPRSKANVFLPARMWTQMESYTSIWWQEGTQGAAGEEGGGSGQLWKGLRSLCIYNITGNNINPELLSRSMDVLKTKAREGSLPFSSLTHLGGHVSSHREENKREKETWKEPPHCCRWSRRSCLRGPGRNRCWKGVVGEAGQSYSET